MQRIDEVIAGDGYNPENALTAANHLMEVVMVRSRERNFNTAFSSAVDKAKKELGLQDAPSEHPVPPGFVEKVVEEMKPYILHHLGKN